MRRRVRHCAGGRWRRVLRQAANCASSMPGVLPSVERSELYGKLAERHPVIGRTMLLESYVDACLLVDPAGGVPVRPGAVGRRQPRAHRDRCVSVAGRDRVEPAGVRAAALACASPCSPRPRTRGSGRMVVGSARWGWRRAQKMIKAADFYHRSLAAALREFSDEWWRVAHPLLVRNGERVFHFAAAALALGLVAGFYLRGVGLEYRAGWESTFLGPTQVRQARAIVVRSGVVSDGHRPADRAPRPSKPALARWGRRRPGGPVDSLDGRDGIAYS